MMGTLVVKGLKMVIEADKVRASCIIEIQKVDKMVEEEVSKGERSTEVKIDYFHEVIKKVKKIT